jgi:hypothetical protein
VLTFIFYLKEKNMLRVLMVLLAMVCFSCVGCKKKAVVEPVQETSVKAEQTPEVKDAVKENVEQQQNVLDKKVEDVNEKI